jgi:hypothetical protein
MFISTIIGDEYITNTDSELPRVVDWSEGVVYVQKGVILPISIIEEVLCVPLDVSCVVELTIPYSTLVIYVF